MALKKVMDVDGKIRGPKELGVYGASYLYSMFQRFGLIQIEAFLDEYIKRQLFLCNFTGKQLASQRKKLFCLFFCGRWLIGSAVF